MGRLRTANTLMMTHIMVSRVEQQAIGPNGSGRAEQRVLERNGAARRSLLCVQNVGLFFGALLQRVRDDKALLATRVHVQWSGDGFVHSWGTQERGGDEVRIRMRLDICNRIQLELLFSCSFAAYPFVACCAFRQILGRSLPHGDA